MSRALVAVLVLLPSPALAAGGEGGLADLAVRFVNVGLLFAVLWYFARKPIAAFFQERRLKIQGDVEAAAQLRAEAEERHARWQRKLANLDAELDQIRATARERAESDKQRIVAEARAAAERIRADARSAVDQELRRAREELRAEASDLSIQLAGEMLKRQVSDGDRDRLIDEFIVKIEQPSSGSGS